MKVSTVFRKNLCAALTFSSVAFPVFSASFFDLARHKTDHLSLQAKAINFNKELLANTIESTVMTRYLNNDDVYLTVYYSVISQLVKQLPERKRLQFLLVYSVSDEKRVKSQQNFYLTKANYEYINYLIETAKNETWQVVLAAVFPCQWLYGEVYQNSTDDNKYYQWLKIYKTARYQNTTNQFVELLNEAYRGSPPVIQHKMLKAFEMSMQFEVAFWRDAYNGKISSYLAQDVISKTLQKKL